MQPPSAPAPTHPPLTQTPSWRRPAIVRAASPFSAALLAVLLLFADPTGSSIAWARQMNDAASLASTIGSDDGGDMQVQPACRTVYDALEPALQSLLYNFPDVTQLLDDESQSLIMFVPTDMDLFVDVFSKGDLSKMPSVSAERFEKLQKLYSVKELRVNLLKYHTSPKNSLRAVGPKQPYAPIETLHYRLDTLFDDYKLNLSVVPSESLTNVNELVVTGMLDHLDPENALCGGSIIQFIDGILVPLSLDAPTTGLVDQADVEDAEMANTDGNVDAETALSDDPKLSTFLMDGKVPIDDADTYLDDVHVFQQILQNASCDCTRSGYSGITVDDDGAVTAYGNTSFVGCGAHLNEEMSGDLNYCYVIGGTDCTSAQPSKLTGDAFEMASYRECVPDSLLPKFFWVKKEKYWMKQFSTKNNMGFINIGCVFAMFGC